MKNRVLRSKLATSLLLGSTLQSLALVACSSSSDAPSLATAGASDAAAGATNTAGSSSTASYDGNGSAAGGYAGTGGSCVPEALTPPSDVPSILQTPSGVTLIYHLHAVGTQDYTCTATPDGATPYSWVFTAPEATLSDSCGNALGTHYAGPGGGATPRWQWTADGSYVQGMKLESSPVAGAIPELLLTATEASAGAFFNVSYVQRLATVGGGAPDAVDCTSANVDELRKSGYSAEYYFYAGTAGGSAY